MWLKLPVWNPSNWGFHLCQCKLSGGLPVFRYHHMSHLMTRPKEWHVRAEKIQISLDIHPVWSASSLSAWRKLGPLATYWTHSEDSDQTGRMPRLISVFAGRTCHFVGFVMRRLILHYNTIHVSGSRSRHTNVTKFRVELGFVDLLYYLCKWMK